MSNLLGADRTDEFRDEEWQQGKLLATPAVRRWDQLRKEDADEQERRCAFVNFTPMDGGRGRQLVRVFDTPNECAEAVREHNRELRFRRAFNRAQQLFIQNRRRMKMGLVTMAVSDYYDMKEEIESLRIQILGKEKELTEALSALESAIECNWLDGDVPQEILQKVDAVLSGESDGISNDS